MITEKSEMANQLRGLISVYWDGYITLTELVHELKCNEFTVLSLEICTYPVNDGTHRPVEVDPYIVANIARTEDLGNPMTFSLQRHNV